MCALSDADLKADTRDRTHITSLLSALAEDGWLEAFAAMKVCMSKP